MGVLKAQPFGIQQIQRSNSTVIAFTDAVGTGTIR